MKYKVNIKGCLSIGNKKFAGGQIYDEKELGDISKIKEFVTPIGATKNNPKNKNSGNQKNIKSGNTDKANKK